MRSYSSPGEEAVCGLLLPANRSYAPQCNVSAIRISSTAPSSAPSTVHEQVFLRCASQSSCPRHTVECTARVQTAATVEQTTLDSVGIGSSAMPGGVICDSLI